MNERKKREEIRKQLTIDLVDAEVSFAGPGPMALELQ